jgi:hypothetical protein
MAACFDVSYFFFGSQSVRFFVRVIPNVKNSRLCFV